MSIHRLKIESDSITAVVVTPTWGGSIEQTREEGEVFFRDKLSGDTTFIGADYALLYNAPDCERIDIYLEEYCADTWVERWRGKFTRYDVRFNENKCTAIVRPAIVDDYQCFIDRINEEYVFSSLDDYDVKSIHGTYQAGKECCQDIILSSDPIPTDPVCAVPDGFCFDKNTNVLVAGFVLRKITSCFHRVKAVGTEFTPPAFGTGWEFLEEVAGVFWWWRCPGDGEADLGRIRHGRLFSETIDYILTRPDCVGSIKSHFFGINADHTAPPDNIAYTYANEYLQNLFVFQKSDIKRPDSSDPAASFVWKMSPKKLLDDLKTIFNVYWVIDSSNQLILEHISYFESISGLNVSTQNIHLDYGKGETSAPNIEKYYWADDASFSVDHAGYPITYGDCGSGVKELRVNLFSNDIFYIREIENQAEISDTGFCLVSAEEDAGTYYVRENNNPMGWVMLHANLHLHYRYFDQGILNDAAETFLSVRKTRKLKQFSVNVCCDEGFNPSDYITTSIGQVDVEKATVNYQSGRENRVITIDSVI